MKEEQGVIYVGNLGAYLAPSDVDAQDVARCAQNAYLRAKIDMLGTMIFSDMYEVRVIDRDGNEDGELSERIARMCERPKVRLWGALKAAWRDAFTWGCSIHNPVWERIGGELVLTALRRLPPESFATPPPGMAATYSPLLPGIVLGEDDEPRCYQVQEIGKPPVELRNVVLIKDPDDPSLAGTSSVVPIVPIVSMLDYCWNAQMQKVNRVGAPILFIKVTNPMEDDIAYAQTILRSWGKSTGFQLRPNMEVVELNLSDSEAALETVRQLEGMIDDYLRPSAFLKQADAPALGGNAAADLAMFEAYIQAERSWVEDAFEGILQRYLDLNQYDGYTVDIRIAVRKSAPGQLELQQAQLGYQSRTLSVNEVRAKLGESEIPDDEIASIAAQWKSVTPAAASPFGFIADQEDDPEEDLEKRLQRLYTKYGRKIIEAVGKGG
jgi:hypothetical protein